MRRPQRRGASVLTGCFTASCCACYCNVALCHVRVSIDSVTRLRSIEIGCYIGISTDVILYMMLASVGGYGLSVLL